MFIYTHTYIYIYTQNNKRVCHETTSQCKNKYIHIIKFNTNEINIYLFFALWRFTDKLMFFFLLFVINNYI